MKHFHYSGSGDHGAQQQGWLMAASRDDAIRQLRGRGIHPYSVKSGPGYIPLRVDEDELLISLRELASLRRGGMALDEAVGAVVSTTDSKPLIQAWQQVHGMVRGGSTLSDAFAAVPDAFPGYAVPLVKLGEANGELAEAISLVANRVDEESTLKSEVRAALTYPVFLLVISFAVVVFMLVSVVPNFGEIVAGSPREVGGSMQLLLALSGLLLDYIWLWGAALVALVALVGYLWHQGRIQAVSWRLLRRVPGISSIVEAWEIVQFSNSMTHLLAGRVNVLDAVQLSAEALSREELQHRLGVATDRIRQGESMGAALSEIGVFPGLVTQMITVGEKSANLPDSMREISRLYTRRMRESIRSLMAVLEPAVIAFMGIVVGGIIVSLLSAIISVNDIPL